MADRYATGDSKALSVLAELQSLSTSLTNNTAHYRPHGPAQTTTPEITAILQNVFQLKGRLANLDKKLRGSTLSVNSISSTVCEKQKSQSNILEKDFTVSGEESPLNCPFSHTIHGTKSTDKINYSHPRDNTESRISEDNRKSIANDPQNSVCGALYTESKNLPKAGPGWSKCPIRFLGHCSPEEVAKYFETHKHEIPRSHEICVKRQQKNEDHIRKLDLKYGNLVSMIEELGQKHQPLLPDDEEISATQIRSNNRLENWAQNVSVNGVTLESGGDTTHDENVREQIFDRQMKDIRVGESPSHPWGISVPVTNLSGRQISSSPESLSMLPEYIDKAGQNPKSDVKKLQQPPDQTLPDQSFLSCKHQQQHSVLNNTTLPMGYEPPVTTCSYIQTNDTKTKAPITPSETQNPKSIKTPQIVSVSGAQMPHITFTGPVFLGYQMEDALKLVHQLK